jgi:hypothetical protein
MTEPEPSSHPQVPQEFLRQLGYACNAHSWTAHWLAPDQRPALCLSTRTEEGHYYVLELEPQALRGIQRIIYSRYCDLVDQGLAREATEIVAGWRVPAPPGADA